MSESVEEHYRSLLQLPSPWQVTSVDSDLSGREVAVRLAWPSRTRAPCPDCGRLCPVHDRMDERSWRHLSVMQYKLELRCSLPRCRCEEHGVRAIKAPWAEPGSRFTLHFEAWAIEVMLACSSLTRACSLLGIHWDSAQRIIDRAVERGMAARSVEGLSRVGLDEKSFLKGQSYVSLMTDIDDPRVLEVLAPLLGRDLKQIINQMHWKPPGAVASEWGYHQDIRFRRPREAYRTPATSYIQTGIAIDPHNEHNGAMTVLPGSHRLGELAPSGGRVMDSPLDDGDLVRLGLDPADVISLDLDPGDLAFWHLHTIHGSGPNRAAIDRRFYLNGYVVAADCDRGEWAFRDGRPTSLGEPVLVHYEQLFERPEPHYLEAV